LTFLIALLTGVLGATEVEGFAVADGLVVAFAVVAGLAVVFALLALRAEVAPDPLGCPMVTDAPVPATGDPVAAPPELKVWVTTTVLLASVPVLQAVNIRARAAAWAIRRGAVTERRMGTTVLKGHPVQGPTRRGARKRHTTNGRRPRQPAKGAATERIR